MSAIPLFPLNIVVFPGEETNLHIFEPRYKQLIKDCLSEGKNFGIPSFVKSKVQLGTEVEILEVSKVYEDERMDIKTKGVQVFNVKKFFNPWNDKKYAGGEIEYIDLDGDTNFQDLEEFRHLVKELFDWLNEEKPQIEQIQSVFDIGHKIGLKPEEEYRLIEIKKESDRLKFAIRHLNYLIPALERAQHAQERIKQNGHFKHLDPLEF